MHDCRLIREARINIPIRWFAASRLPCRNVSSIAAITTSIPRIWTLLCGSACLTEPSDLIASRIERSRGQDWRYGDCSPEQWPGIVFARLMKGSRDATMAKDATIEGGILMAGAVGQIAVPLITSLAASALVRWAKSYGDGYRTGRHPS